MDWLHTSQDQGALVRPFIKWDAQPASVEAMKEAMLRAAQISQTAPKGPTYVCFDSSIQEAEQSGKWSAPQVERFQPPAPVFPSESSVNLATDWLKKAKNPVVLMGRVSHDQVDWDERVRFIEAIGAKVLTDLKVGAAFPTRHPAQANNAGYFLSAEGCQILKKADVVLSLDWCDLGGTLKQAWGTDPVGSKIIQVSLDHVNHNGWSMDHQSLPPVDLFIAAEPREAVGAFLGKLQAKTAAVMVPAYMEQQEPQPKGDSSLRVQDVAHALRLAVSGIPISLLRLPLGWSGDMWDWESPLDYLGYDGGGGIGSGPGMSIGAALALMGSGRLPIAILGDGDFMMGVSAFWTAANANIPLLTVVCNNHSFFNDELHQERWPKTAVALWRTAV
ncbi:thiamine pyrophosphate-dependent enzyme [Polaromonas sp. P1(28)-8]|nr:thiamine pyrophosphate-dependent enzyme [Polaromonas sp. P1(28)-8]